MKNSLLFLLVLLTGLTSLAQSEVQPAYKRFPTLPPLELLQVDSIHTLTKDHLKRNQPTIIMYFSPECDHCQHQTEDMLKHMDELKKYQIVMATYQPFEEMVAFYQKYKLVKYSNIMMGRDTKFVLPPFYKIGSLPFLALYNKRGYLITTFQGNVSMEKLMQAFAEN